MIIEFDGLARGVRVTTPTRSRNYAMNAFEILKRNHVLLTLFGIVTWFLPTSLGALRAIRDSSRNKT
jgi:hypothetical protein